MSALDACHRARQAWQRTQDQLDIFSVLNAASDPEPERGAAGLAFPLGRSVEGGRTKRQGRDGRGSESARAWLTAAATWHASAHGGSQGTPPPSTKTKQGEEA